MRDPHTRTCSTSSGFGYSEIDSNTSYLLCHMESGNYFSLTSYFHCPMTLGFIGVAEEGTHLPPRIPIDTHERGGVTPVHKYKNFDLTLLRIKLELTLLHNVFPLSDSLPPTPSPSPSMDK